MALAPSQKRLLFYGVLGTVAAICGYKLVEILKGMDKMLGPEAFGAPNCADTGGTSGEVAGMRYLERLSPGASAAETLPMVVLFHSKGATPNGFAGFASGLDVPCRVILPEGPGALGSGRDWFSLPARTQDQAELEAQMRWTGERTAKFVADIVRCRPTRGLPVVCGSSQGGSMSLMMANLYPGLVRGAVAVCGWIPVPMWSRSMAPTVVIHGTQDQTVPYDWTRDSVDRMRDLGAPIRMESFPVGHTVSSDMSISWRRAVEGMLA
jgi:phospholipase/carboxylesterase